MPATAIRIPPKQGPKAAHFLPPDLFYAELHFFLEPNAHLGV
jgi:hypothetical protein